jgi:hypothetical protein
MNKRGKGPLSCIRLGNEQGQKYASCLITLMCAKGTMDNGQTSYRGMMTKEE